MQVQTISKSKLKAKMLQIFRELEANGEELIVTDHNVPVLRIIPIKKKKTVEEAFGKYQDGVIFYEDPDTPTIAEWKDA